MAGLIGLFDWLLFVPPNSAGARPFDSALKRGDCVMESAAAPAEIFPTCATRSGPMARVYGVDLSHRDAGKAQALCDHR